MHKLQKTRKDGFNAHSMPWRGNSLTPTNWYRRLAFDASEVECANLIFGLSVLHAGFPVLHIGPVNNIQSIIAIAFNWGVRRVIKSVFLIFEVPSDDAHRPFSDWTDLRNAKWHDDKQGLPSRYLPPRTYWNDCRRTDVPFAHVSKKYLSNCRHSQCTQMCHLDPRLRHNLLTRPQSKPHLWRVRVCRLDIARGGLLLNKQVYAVFYQQ